MAWYITFIELDLFVLPLPERNTGKIITLANKLHFIVVLYIIQGEFSVNYQSSSKEHPRANILFNSLIYFLQFDNIFYFV